MSTLDIAPLTGALCAEIFGVDLAQTLPDTTIAAIRRALGQYGVVFFRDQTFDAEQHKAFARNFGKLHVHPFIYADALPGEPEVLRVVKEKEDRRVFGERWHADVTFLEKPLLGAALYALETPAKGGDTLFANMYDAYEALSEGMRRMLDGLNAMHSGRPYGVGGVPGDLKVSRSIGIERNRPEADREVAHPVVRVHPVTGRKALFVNAIYTTRFEDMTEAESRPLLDFLFAHAIRPEFTCRLRWRTNDLAVWDNRCAMHRRDSFDPNTVRLMHRTAIQGERPVLAI